MLSAAATAIRALRFRLWTLVLRARLARHGVRVSVRAAGTPRFFTLPALEPITLDGRGGSLTLSLGRGAKLGRGLVLEVWSGHDNVLEVGEGSTFEAWCRVQLAGGTIALGDHVHVRDLCLLKTKSSLRVGDGTVLSRGVNVHATGGVEIGPNCGIGERTSFIDSDHTVDVGEVPVLERPIRVEPIRLGRNVLVSANCVLLRGTEVGDGAVVAANSVLNGGHFDGGWLVAGAPATAKRELPVGG